MRRALETSLEHGAIGMSTGLYYPPAKDAPTDEVIALAKPMRAYGGIHTTHMRDEASHLVESVNETIEIGKAAGIPDRDLAPQGERHRRTMAWCAETLKLIDEARKTPEARPRRLSLRRGFDHARPAPPFAREQDHRHLVEELVRNSPARRSMRSRSSSAATSSEAASRIAAGRRHLLHDERGRRPPRAVLSAHHDRLRRPAARRASASAAVGHVSARARTLRARRQAVPAGRGGAADDRAAGRAVRAQGPRQPACRRLRRSGAVRSAATIADTATFEQPKTPAAGIALCHGQRPHGLERRRRNRQAGPAARCDGTRSVRWAAACRRIDPPKAMAQLLLRKSAVRSEAMNDSRGLRWSWRPRCSRSHGGRHRQSPRTAIPRTRRRSWCRSRPAATPTS